jgi:hypothetical protein
VGGGGKFFSCEGLINGSDSAFGGLGRFLGGASTSTSMGSGSSTRDQVSFGVLRGMRKDESDRREPGLSLSTRVAVSDSASDETSELSIVAALRDSHNGLEKLDDEDEVDAVPNDVCEDVSSDVVSLFRPIHQNPEFLAWIFTVSVAVGSMVPI